VCRLSGTWLRGALWRHENDSEHEEHARRRNRKCQQSPGGAIRQRNPQHPATRGN
jgi:hypothetical protein